MRIPKKNKKKDFFWNLAGSFINAFFTLILTVLVVRLGSQKDAGIIGYVIGLSFILSTFGLYGVRGFQVSDSKEEFSFVDYKKHRYFTSVLMLIITIIYIFSGRLFFKVSTEESLVLLCFCIYKVFFGISDVYQGNFQQKDYTFLAGKSLAFQVTLALAGFLITYYFSKNLVLSSFVMAIFAILSIIIFDTKKNKLWNEGTFSSASIKKLTIICFPLFLSEFLNMLQVNLSKVILNFFHPMSQVAWTAIFMPASIINLLSLFILRPILPTLTKDWLQDKPKFFIKISKYLKILILITIVALVGTYLLGIPVLEFIYKLPLKDQKTNLMLIILSGGFSAAATFLYYVTTIQRRQTRLLYAGIITTLISLILTPVFIYYFDLVGASFAFLITMFLRCTLFYRVAKK